MMRFFERLVAVEIDSSASHEENLRLAAVALMFRALLVDGVVDAAEEVMIRRIVEDEFGLTPQEVDQLLVDASASADAAPDLYGWIKLINGHYSHEEKCYLLEKLWQVVLADGVVDALEASLMRKVAGLIYVSDRDSAEARHRAERAIV